MTGSHWKRGWKRGNAAFGLLALLIVAAIVLYVMFGMGGGTGSGGGGSGGGGGGGNGYVGEVAATRKSGLKTEFAINSQQLGILISQWRSEHNGKLPSTVAELEAPPGSFTDHWGKEMTFTFSDGASGTAVTYRSAGPDGQVNTADDVTATGTLPF